MVTFDPQKPTQEEPTNGHLSDKFTSCFFSTALQMNNKQVPSSPAFRSAINLENCRQRSSPGLATGKIDCFPIPKNPTRLPKIDGGGEVEALLLGTAILPSRLYPAGAKVSFITAGTWRSNFSAHITSAVIVTLRKFLLQVWPCFDCVPN